MADTKVSSDDAVVERIAVIAADADGLVAKCDQGKRLVYAWARIVNIMGVMVDHHYAGRIMLLTFEIRDERTILLNELEPAWRSVVASLQRHLRGALPFSLWGSQLVQRPGFTEVYQASL
ncbi:hypothetical protein [Sphingomonas crocodyli]|uniref:Uncharacterized protein n=1 Tax=Sphingomonas crocodyli TaxID=1979270 RepID=A0A437M7H8_9SPHN|nr:hypothetical protein [Sphingomonas crocodyli]RVT93506.1 hypothetical protein EOD43_06435 [Sphingomonas crocodyli]